MDKQTGKAFNCVHVVLFISQRVTLAALLFGLGWVVYFLSQLHVLISCEMWCGVMLFDLHLSTFLFLHKMIFILLYIREKNELIKCTTY